MSSEWIATLTAWCAAICTFAILSVLYRENRFYRLFEHIFIGVAAGFGLYTTWSQVLQPDWWKPMVTEGKLTLSDGEQTAGWEGVTEMHAKEGKRAIRWDLTRTPSLFTQPTQTDWSRVQYLRFWLYSENAAGAQVFLALQSSAGQGEAGPPEEAARASAGNGAAAKPALPPLPEDSWVAELPIGFRGWQPVLLHHSAFRPIGHPDWAAVRQVGFILVPATAPPGAALHIDEFWAFQGRQRLIREGRLEIHTAVHPARWEGRTETVDSRSLPGGAEGPPQAMRWSGKMISTPYVRRKDWATLQYLHLWLYAERPQADTLQITLHSQFEDKEAEKDEEGRFPLKEGKFQAALPLQFQGWQECVLHRSRFVPEGEASWLHIARLSLSRSSDPPPAGEGIEPPSLYVGDVVAYTGRTRWTLSGEVKVSDCDDPTAWPGATADYVKEKEGALQWRPAESPEIALASLPLNDWSKSQYLRLWARVLPPPEGGSGAVPLPVTVKIHTEKQEEAKDQPRGEEQWTKVGTFTAQITLQPGEWTAYQIPLAQFALQGEPDWKGVQRVAFSLPPASVPAGTVVCLDDVALYNGRKWYWALALVAGLMFYSIYSKRYVWFNRLIIAVLMGLGAGAAFKGFVTEMFPQVSSSFKPLWGGGLTPLQIFNNVVFVATLLCVLMYFFFSFEHKHPVVRGSARMGRWLLMICFGVIFGNTVMGRMSLFIDRLMFLINDWWPRVIGAG